MVFPWKSVMCAGITCRCDGADIQATHKTVLTAGVGWVFSLGCWPGHLHGPLHGLGSHSMRTGSESNIPRKSVPERPTRNCKASYDLALVSSETSAATLYLEYVTRESTGSRMGCKPSSWWKVARSLSGRACGIDMFVAIFGKCNLPHSVSENPLERTFLWLSSCFTKTD